MQQTQKTLTALQRLVREASLRLVNGMFAQDVSTASYGYLQECQQSLSEAQQVMMQLQNELAQASVSAGSGDQSSGLNPRHVPAQTVQPAEAILPSTGGGGGGSIPKRGRGRAKGRYLCNDDYKPRYRQHLVNIFRDYYIQDGDAFRTTDGSPAISASVFLACLYSVGVERGITAPSPSVKPMTDIIDDLFKPTSSPHHIASYITSYKTIMAKVNDWRNMVTRQKRNLAHLYLHDITPEDLAPGQHPAYEEWLHALRQAERIYDLTLPPAEGRNA